jgi:hypothetical protein
MAGSKASSVGRYYKSAQPCFLVSCIRHIIEQGLASHRIVIIGMRPYLAPASRAPAVRRASRRAAGRRARRRNSAEVVHRCTNVSRRDVSSRTAGVVFIQLVRGTTFTGASFPGTIISRVRRAPHLPRAPRFPRPPRAASPAFAARTVSYRRPHSDPCGPRLTAPPASPRSALPHCPALRDSLPNAQLSAGPSSPPLPPVPVTPNQVPPFPPPPTLFATLCGL